MFLLTITFLNTEPTRQELETVIGQMEAVAQKRKGNTSATAEDPVSTIGKERCFVSYRPPRISRREAMREESRQFRLRMAAQHGDRTAQRKTVLGYLAKREGRAA